ncbi:penicillin-binding transpeptidase domain-containing protein [Paenibacillus filicis]|uniref:Penicillin-binding transpeptidase domain-containing protein n=1 Tax=Paenibacillus gyeongsangnamensis TaxID=3388067 RepID=A0ABT4QKV2_9BACL|nr:penicillin-binding transpeptidase domain-containing protein [Paenibacillus filicis]MCZ8517497.1 penicillin-binding transpeptidase domain-containing protein [Paenibacillus filicis]
MKKQLSMDDPQKYEANKRRQFTLRVNIFFFCTFFLFSVLIVRLAVLQFVDGKELKAQKADLGTRSTPIPPIRGNIFDRQHYPIAYTTSTQSLYFRIESPQNKDDVVALAKKLADIFAKYGDPKQKQLSPEDIIKEMDVGYDINKAKTTEPSYYAVPRRIKAGLSQNEMAYIMEHRDELKWLEIIEESIRTYDPKPIAVQLVGYMRPYSAARTSNLELYKNKDKTTGYLETEDVGFDGIELMYQEQLRGQNGAKSYPVNATQKIVGRVEVTKPEKGDNLFLTIDKDVQRATEQAILDQLKWLKSPEALSNPYANRGRNAVAGYAVAMEVDTGKVVAMASMPDYDPSVWSGGIPKSEYDRIQPFVNNGTITTAYPDYPEKERGKHPSSIVYMGSTIKPLSVLVGMKEGLITPTSPYNDTGSFTFGKDNSKISNSDSAAYGMLTAWSAVWHSSNTFMSAMIGNPLAMRDGQKAPDIWASYLAKFGLGVLTGSGLPREYPGLNEFKTNTKESIQSRMVYASWGQNEKYTTLQLAQYATTLATKGKRLQPLLVDRVETYEGKMIQKFDQPIVLDESNFPNAYWDSVYKGMQLVSVNNFFDGFPYSFARKTGTSTQSIAGKDVDNAVFVAFAPVEKPKLAVAVVVPEGGFGSWGAAPIARKIFDAYDQYYGLDDKGPKGPKTGTTP